MRSCVLVVLLCLISLLAGCGNGGNGGEPDGGDGGVLPCDLQNNPCPEGQRCDRDQECVEALALEIVTDSLPDGRLGFGYDEFLEAAGGLEPYTWELVTADTELSFLGLSVTGRLQGTADQAVQGASLTVAVTDDGYGGGERVEKSFLISIDICRNGDTELCYTPQVGACFQGSRTCTDGEMGACTAGPNPSADRNQCGPDCDRCDAAVADACNLGLCACGTGDLCTGADFCCDGQCTGVDANTAHCGMCFNDCEQAVAHASSADKFCSGGTCDYTGDCDYGFLDCDGQRPNGCERPANRVESCGGCQVDCNDLVGHVLGSQKACTDTGSEFVCDYSGSCNNDFEDCDLDRTNGCETWLTEVASCGGCGIDCSQDPVGVLCISPNPEDPYEHVCGCNYDSATGQAEGCAAGQICCQHVCRDAVADNEHCGVCNAACTAGDCTAGACACADMADCPADSGTDTCSGSACVCSNAGAGNAACPVGQYCCDGTAGGSGGPNGEQDMGCCIKRCGQNDDQNFICTP